MASLLGKLIGQETPEVNAPTIPDTVPPDWAADLAPDPEPGDAVPKRGPASPAKTSGTVTPTLKKRIEAEVAMYIEFAAMPIVLRDEVCGNAIHQQAEPIAKAITQILSRYPDLAHKFLATGNIGDWIKLAVALQPVGKVIWEHHVTKPEQEVTAPDVDFDNFEPYRPGQ